jgi:hypothetical protein
LNASKRSLSSSQIRDAVDFDSFPSPACSYSDSTSRIDNLRTNAPITNAFNGSVRNSFGVLGNSLDANVSAASRTLRDRDLKLPLASLHLARAKPVTQGALVVAQPTLILRPALVTSPAKPRVELVLHGALDDQPGAELGECRQRLARVLADPHGQHRSICASISADGGTVRLTA